MEIMRHRLAKLKQHSAEHMLEVVRYAKKQEVERQKKLKHATSKANLAYLEKRFARERGNDQIQISRLLQDADAVEAALLQSSYGQCPGNCTNDNSSREARSPPAGRIMEGILAGGLNGSNAAVEPDKSKEDTEFMSTNQIAFMKYVYKHLDEEKATRAVGCIVAQINGENRSNKRRTRSTPCGMGGGRQLFRNYKHSTTSPQALTKASTAAGQGREVDRVCAGSRRGGKMGGAPLPCVRGRRRLLEEKRGILMELKEIVGRQAEALDRLVEGCVATNGGKTASTINAVGGGSSHSGNFGDWSRHKSYRARIHGGSRSSRGNDGERLKPHSTSTTSASVYRNTSGSVKDTSTVSSSTSSALSRAAEQETPPTSSENATSAFLTRGGRWEGKVARRDVSRKRNSVASTASYATYCERAGGKGGEAAVRLDRHPSKVPMLPIGDV